MEPTVANTDPGITWVQDKPVDTNWDPAQYTRVTAGLISKYPDLDAYVSDYGAATVGLAAGVPERGQADAGARDARLVQRAGLRLRRGQGRLAGLRDGLGRGHDARRPVGGPPRARDVQRHASSTTRRS